MEILFYLCDNTDKEVVHISKYVDIFIPCLVIFTYTTGLYYNPVIILFCLYNNNYYEIFFCTTNYYSNQNLTDV